MSRWRAGPIGSTCPARWARRWPRCRWISAGRQPGPKPRTTSSPPWSAWPPACRRIAADLYRESLATGRQVAAERRPFVWVDDEAIAEDDFAWAERLAVPSLFVRPDPTEGLTPEQLTTIEEFVTSFADG